MAKKKKRKLKTRNPMATVLKDAAFHQRVVRKPKPKDIKPEVKDEWE